VLLKHNSSLESAPELGVTEEVIFQVTGQRSKNDGKNYCVYKPNRGFSLNFKRFCLIG